MAILQLLVTTVALLLIALTMFLRAHELKDKGFRWNLRRAGLCLAGIGAAWTVLWMWLGRELGLPMMCMSVGLFLVFFTTPNGIPWHLWVWKGLKDELALPLPTLRDDRESEINRQRDVRP